MAAGELNDLRLQNNKLRKTIGRLNMVRTLQLDANQSATIVIQKRTENFAVNPARMRIVRGRPQVIARKHGGFFDDCVETPVRVRELAGHHSGLVIVNMASDLDLQIVHAAILDPLQRAAPAAFFTSTANT